MSHEEGRDRELDPRETPRLAEALGRLYGPPVEVPAEVDAAILARVRLRLSRPPRRAAPWIAAAGAAAAAVLVVALFLRAPDVRRAAAPLPAVAAAPREDFDRDGLVNILDAFALARRIEGAGPAPDRAWDLNSDGAVDRKDVDAIAMAAVRVDGGRLR